MFHFCFVVAKTSSHIILVKTVQTGSLGGLPSKEEKKKSTEGLGNKHWNDYKGWEERCFGISGRSTKETQSWTAAPGEGERASSLSQLILCKKERSALGQRLILRFHPPIKILQPVITLIWGLRKNSLFYLGRTWIIEGLHYGTSGVYSNMIVHP